MTTFKRSDPLLFEFDIQSIRSSSRVVVDQYGRQVPLTTLDEKGEIIPRRPAIFEGKALRIPSDCPIHPKYQALRPPRSEKAGCGCAAIYRQMEEWII